MSRAAGRRSFRTSGWHALAAGVLVHVLVSGLMMQSFGTYAAAWRSDFGWTKTAIALAFSVQRLGRGVLGLAQGWLLRRFGTRETIVGGVAVFAAGLVALSLVDGFALFVAGVLLMGTGASLAGPISLNTLAVDWFRSQRARALSVVSIGMSVGGFAVPLVAIAITTMGWRPTLQLSAVLTLALGIPAALRIRNAPQEDDVAGASSSPERPGGLAVPRDLRTGEAVRTRAFWYLSIGHALAVLVVAAVQVHIVVHLTERLGFDLRLAGLIVAVMTGATLAGQVLGGVIGDRTDKRRVVALAMLGHTVALLAVAHARSLAPVVFFAIVHGVAWGIRGPQIHALRADLFGRSSFPKILGVASAIVTLGGLAGPVVAGVLADATGDYRLGFTLLAVATGLGSLFFVALRPPKPR